ncbi:MAG: MoxR family ATPase [Flavobacteriales bacterium]|jgi:MoxR-like ATPase|nr:MoxR family ATPase [Flavobacteriales bacterium]
MEENNPTQPENNAQQPQEEQAQTAKAPITEQPIAAASQEYSTSFSGSRIDLSLINEKITKARNEISNYLVGQHEMVDLLLIGLFSGGHILLEGVPGIAKTLTAKVLAQTLSVDFSRIQFTPDMMPSDIIGTSIFNMKTSEFSFKKGPIFTNIALIDEINRAPAKTQAALFEVMEERQITYDGVTHKLDFPFLVIATQNPVEQEGTYRLPEAQLDRFLFKINLNYPSLDEEKDILTRYKSGISVDFDKIANVFSKADLKTIQETISQVRVEDSIIKYIAEITHNTRNHGKLYLGASPRASLSMLKASKTMAAMRGRDFVIPDDVQYVAYHVINHRIILTPEAEMEGMTEANIIQEIIKAVEVPR